MQLCLVCVVPSILTRMLFRFVYLIAAATSTCLGLPAYAWADPSAPATSSAAAMTSQNSNPPAFLTTTACVGDIPADTFLGDPDVAIRDDATVNVMFHGNRFVAAPELVAAFERLNPGERVSWTALPPANTRRAVANGPQSFAGSKPFFPDVVLMPLYAQTTASGKKLINRGLYSNLHGIVLIARADDENVSGTDVSAIVNNPSIKVVLAGRQALNFPLIAVSGIRFDEANTDAGAHTPRYGVSQQRHHRSVPARILAGCEDVGFEYLQSQPYLEQQFPGRFKFTPVAMSAEDAATEASYIYLVPDGRHGDAAEKFISFMKSRDALMILRKYRLEP